MPSLTSHQLLCVHRYYYCGISSDKASSVCKIYYNTTTSPQDHLCTLNLYRDIIEGVQLVHVDRTDREIVILEGRQVRILIGFLS